VSSPEARFAKAPNSSVDDSIDLSTPIVEPSTVSDKWLEETDQAAIERRHQQLIETILQEEEDMIASHRAHVDEVMELIRQEMAELNNVDQPGSSIDAYITNLDTILKRKIHKINALRERLHQFKRHLREETRLSRHFAARDGGS